MSYCMTIYYFKTGLDSKERTESFGIKHDHNQTVYQSWNLILSHDLNMSINMRQIVTCWQCTAIFVEQVRSSIKISGKSFDKGEKCGRYYLDMTWLYCIYWQLKLNLMFGLRRNYPFYIQK